MSLFSDRDRDGSDIRYGDGALDVLIIALLIAFAFGVWFLYGSVRPVFESTNPTLIAHPAPASGPYHAAPPSP